MEGSVNLYLFDEWQMAYALLTAVPNEGYTLAGWQVLPSTGDHTIRQTSVIMPIFEPVSYEVSAHEGHYGEDYDGWGTVTGKTLKVNEGAKYTIDGDTVNIEGYGSFKAVPGRTAQLNADDPWALHMGSEWIYTDVPKEGYITQKPVLRHNLKETLLLSGLFILKEPLTQMMVVVQQSTFKELMVRHLQMQYWL